VTVARVALIGYGLGGALFHAPFIDAVEGLELAAIVTRDPERRERARREHPDVELLDSADEVWLRSDELELAVVATPNRLHAPLARAAIEAGVAVVVDKPFTTTADEARQLVRDASAQGVLLTVFQNRRWDGDILTVRRLLGEGTFGNVIRFESRFDRWRPQLSGAWRESGAAGEAGGLLYDLGTHLVDQALQLFGGVESVYAELDARRPGAEADDDAFVALAHVSGVRSHLWMTVLAAQPRPRLCVLGDRAAYVKHGVDVQEEQLRAGMRPGDRGWGEEPKERWGQLGSGTDVRRIRTEPGTYQRFYEGVSECLREGAPPPVDPVEAVAALEVLDAARASAAERRVIELGGSAGGKAGLG
jgi:predicted dehydrogenase